MKRSGNWFNAPRWTSTPSGRTPRTSRARSEWPTMKPTKSRNSSVAWRRSQVKSTVRRRKKLTNASWFLFLVKRLRLWSGRRTRSTSSKRKSPISSCWRSTRTSRSKEMTRRPRLMFRDSAPVLSRRRKKAFWSKSTSMGRPRRVWEEKFRPLTTASKRWNPPNASWKLKKWGWSLKRSTQTSSLRTSALISRSNGKPALRSKKRWTPKTTCCKNWKMTTSKKRSSRRNATKSTFYPAPMSNVKKTRSKTRKRSSKQSTWT